MLPIRAQESGYVHQQIKASNQPIDAVTFSPDGQSVATAGRDQTIYLWDWELGEQSWQSRSHEDWVTALAFSPDGEWLYTGSRDLTVRRVHTQTGELDSILGQHDAAITSLDTSPDGQWVASSDNDGIVHLYDAASSQQVSRLENESGPIWQVLFSDDGSYLAVASEDGTVALYTVGDWMLSRSQSVYDNPVTQVIFAEGSQQIVTGSLSGQISMRDIGSETAVVSSEGHRAPIMGLSWLDSQHMVSSSLDGTLIIWQWDGSSLQPVYRYESGSPLLGHASTSDKIALVDHQGMLTLLDVPQQLVSLTPNDMMVERSNVASPSEPAPTLPAPSVMISSVGIESEVTTFPLDGEGRTWDIDLWEHRVGHFYGTSWLGTAGNIVLGAHSEYPDGTPGTFHALVDVGLGDAIIVRDSDLSERYIVTHIHSVDYRDVSVVYPTGDQRLTLITCDIPSYVADQGLYYERLVVVAQKLD